MAAAPVLTLPAPSWKNTPAAPAPPAASGSGGTAIPLPDKISAQAAAATYLAALVETAHKQIAEKEAARQKLDDQLAEMRAGIRGIERALRVLRGQEPEPGGTRRRGPRPAAGSLSGRLRAWAAAQPAPFAPAAAADALGAEQNAVTKLLSSLCLRGQIERVAPSRYRARRSEDAPAEPHEGTNA